MVVLTSASMLAMLAEVTVALTTRRNCSPRMNASCRLLEISSPLVSASWPSRGALFPRENGLGSCNGPVATGVDGLGRFRSPSTRAGTVARPLQNERCQDRPPDAWGQGHAGS